MRYALLLNSPEATPGVDVPEEAMREMQAAMAAYTEALHRSGVFASADILVPQADTKTVTRRTGELQVQDGPFAETREAMAGVFLIDVPDEAAALKWAEKCPASQYAVIEVRAVAARCVDGVWQRA